MSIQKYRQILKKQLEKINNKIDTNIIRGIPYTKESKEHKRIVKLLTAAK